MTCVRSAWLVLGALSQPLEDEAAGYICPSLDLGSPEVRDVVTNRPDHHGVDDRTRYFGSRAITADVVALTPDARIDEIATVFAPFMRPDVRPELHYVLDRADNPERVLTMRAASYDWPIKGPEKREIHLQWVAADPIARDPVVHSSSSWSGSAIGAGRIYDLTFPREYPQGSTPPITGQLFTDGDVAVRPKLLFYGPIVGPEVAFRDESGNAQIFAFKNGTTIDAGSWIEVDTDARTAYWNGDLGRSAMNQIDWPRPTAWIICQSGIHYTFTLSADGGGANQVSQVVAQWRDGYLS